MSPSSLARTALILGYDPRISTGIKDMLLAQGFNVGTVSRSAKPDLDGINRLTHVVGDLSSLGTVENTFKTITDKYGPVSTVIWNAGGNVRAPVQGSPFSIPVDKVAGALDAGLFSAYRAAQLLLESKHDGPKHFIYIGNVCHTPGHAWPALYVQGLNKASAAHMIEVGAKAYGRKGGPMFYNLWEINNDGTIPITGISPDGHADMVSELVGSTEQGAWEVPFSTHDGKGRRAREDLVIKTDW